MALVESWGSWPAIACKRSAASRTSRVSPYMVQRRPEGLSPWRRRVRRRLSPTMPHKQRRRTEPLYRCQRNRPRRGTAAASARGAPWHTVQVPGIAGVHRPSSLSRSPSRMTQLALPTMTDPAEVQERRGVVERSKFRGSSNSSLLTQRFESTPDRHRPPSGSSPTVRSARHASERPYGELGSW